MLCRYCGNTISDKAKFCNKCRQPVVSPPTPDQLQTRLDHQQAAQQSVKQANQTDPVSSSAAPTDKKRTWRPGCLILTILILLIITVLGYVIYTSFFGDPKDLGIRYTPTDFKSAMAKTGLVVDFMGMSDSQLAVYIENEDDQKLNIDDYKWVFSGFREKKFELTPAEATAFINEVAPLFSWFDDVQMANLGNNKAASSYKVHFDKVKKELIADVVDQIPTAIAALLPDTFNLYIVGAPFTIIENELTMPAQLDELKIGAVSLRPFIGDTDAATRAMVMDYIERIYKQIPQLKIHSLKTNANKNFEFSGFIPTKVSITKK